MKRKATYLIGIDEAGRGPLAGPVAVGAVVSENINKKLEILENGIKDSKKLSALQREEWFNIIKANFYYKVSCVGPEVIDKIGITKAARLAIFRAVEGISKRFDLSDSYIMLDGLLHAPKEYKQETIIKGDEKIPLISAASIMAKVLRDRKMENLHKKMPAYGFNSNKGYGTKFHIEKIKELGISVYHRKSYCHFFLDF